MERCPSGLRSTLGKRVWLKDHRGFESHPFRQSSPYFQHEIRDIECKSVCFCRTWVRGYGAVKWFGCYVCRRARLKHLKGSSDAFLVTHFKAKPSFDNPNIALRDKVIPAPTGEKPFVFLKIVGKNPF